MGNYLFCGDSQKFLEQLKRHLNTGEILKSCVIGSLDPWEDQD